MAHNTISFRLTKEDYAKLMQLKERDNLNLSKVFQAFTKQLLQEKGISICQK